MATAIFSKPFRFDRRPRQALCFEIKASEQPQSLPRDVVEAAIAAGAATPVPKKRTRSAAKAASESPRSIPPERKNR